MAAPSISLVDSGDIPLELGDVANLKAARKNKTPVPRPDQFLEVVQCDIGYGDCKSVGGVRYVMTFVDRCTRYTWVHGLTSLSHENIVWMSPPPPLHGF